MQTCKLQHASLERKLRPADHLCRWSKEKTHHSPSFLNVYRNPPAQLAALAACPSQASGGGNQNHASFSFSPNAIFQELGEAGSQSLSSFSQGVNDFHELILFRKEEDYILYIYIYIYPRWQDVAVWGLQNGCYRARKPKYGHTHPLTSQNSPST